MSRADRDKILISAYALLIIVAFFVFWRAQHVVNPYYIGLAAWILQQLYVIPQMNLRYSQLNDKSSDWKRYIPLWNEYDIFSERLGKLYLWSGILAYLFLLIAVLPAMGVSFVTAIFESIFGQSFAVNLTYNFIWVFVALYFVMAILRGIEYIGILRHVNRIYLRNFGRSKPIAANDALQFIAVFIPAIRAISLFFISMRISKMMIFNDLEDSTGPKFRQL